jgi:hypothetical protein
MLCLIVCLYSAKVLRIFDRRFLDKLFFGLPVDVRTLEVDFWFTGLNCPPFGGVILALNVRKGLSRIHRRHTIGVSHDEYDRCIVWITMEGEGVGFI